MSVAVAAIWGMMIVLFLFTRSSDPVTVGTIWLLLFGALGGMAVHDTYLIFRGLNRLYREDPNQKRQQ